MYWVGRVYGFLFFFLFDIININMWVVVGCFFFLKMFFKYKDMLFLEFFKIVIIGVRVGLFGFNFFRRLERICC